FTSELTSSFPVPQSLSSPRSRSFPDSARSACQLCLPSCASKCCPVRSRNLSGLQRARPHSGTAHGRHLPARRCAGETHPHTPVTPPFPIPASARKQLTAIRTPDADPCLRSCPH